MLLNIDRGRFEYAWPEAPTLEMSSSLGTTASDAIELLEARLQRVRYVIGGHNSEKTVTQGRKPACSRLEDIEHGLDQLTAKSKIIQDLLKLHARYPDLLSSRESSLNPLTLDTKNKLSTVIATASLFPQAASYLISINDTPLPTAELSTELIDTWAELAKLQILQERQSQEITALRQRTAAVLQRWYSIDIIQIGEYWANLEDMVEIMEQNLRRTSTQKHNEVV